MATGCVRITGCLYSGLESTGTGTESIEGVRFEDASGVQERGRGAMIRMGLSIMLPVITRA